MQTLNQSGRMGPNTAEELLSRQDSNCWPRMAGDCCLFATYISIKKGLYLMKPKG